MPVAAVLLGRPFHEVVVKVGFDELGRPTLAYTQGESPIPVEEWEEASYPSSDVDRAAVDDEIVVLYAGEAAEIELIGSASADGADSDTDRIALLLRALDIPADAWLEYTEPLRSRAVRLASKGRDAIQQVARLIEQHGRVDRADVERALG